ncbi:MAG: MTH1187 family thiamine-binding protein [Euryarchaeota archaeon]|nr:MTH1187 family thiamine-binding protein [Euryarchaeota archaeon]
MIIAELTITPLGEGISVSRYVKKAYAVIKSSGLKHELTPMSTVLEARTLDEIFEVVKKAEEAVLEEGAMRVVIDIKIDHRVDKDATMNSKKKAILGDGNV